MYNCSYINFNGLINSSNKSDFIEQYLTNNNFDILFITNYNSNSINFDVIDDEENENVFIDILEDKYNIYKGQITNNICNVIIIKKSLGNFTYIEKNISHDVIIKPLQIYSKQIDLNLICLNNSESASNIAEIIDFINNNNNNNYIIGGYFNTQLKNINITTLNKSIITNEDILNEDTHNESNNNLVYENTLKEHYLEKFKYGIIFNNLNFDNLILRKTHLFSNTIIETLLTKKYTNNPKIHYLYNIFKNIKKLLKKLFSL